MLLEEPSLQCLQVDRYLEWVHSDDRNLVKSLFLDEENQDSANYRLHLPGRPPKRVRHMNVLKHAGILHGMLLDTSQLEFSLDSLLKKISDLREGEALAGLGRWELRPDGTLFWSSAVRALLGVSSDFVPDPQSALQFVSGTENRRMLREAADLAFTAGRSFRMDVPLLTHGGEPIWVELRGQPEFQGNRCIRIFGTIQDITTGKQLQEEQSQESHNARLQSRNKTEFIARLSHELGNPLNAVKGFAELLRKPEIRMDPNKVLGHAEEIHRAAEHMEGLLQDATDLSRIESNHIHLRLESIDVDALLDGCIRLTEPMAQRFNVSILYQPPSEFTTVRGDRRALRQCILNLLTNAIKYNRPDGKVQVETTGRDGALRIVVQDTGWGIPEEKKALIYQPFQRLGMEATGIEGTGLGLVLTRNLVHRMGGILDFHSLTGKGSTFWLELPLADSSAEPALKEAIRPPGQLQHELTGTVLYLEDNPLNLRLMEHLLQGYSGLKLLTASTVRQARELARSERIHLFLIDQLLPDGTGTEFATSLQNIPENRHSPRICISADSHSQPEPETAGESTDIVFHGFLAKPFSVDDLHAKLTLHLQ